MSTAWGTVKDEAKEVGEDQVTYKKSLIIRQDLFALKEWKGATYPTCILKAIFWDNMEDTLEEVGQYEQIISFQRNINKVLCAL